MAATKMEERMERTVAREKAAGIRAEHKAKIAKKKEKGTVVRAFKATAKVLLRELAKLTRITYRDNAAEFMFQGQLWWVSYDKWTIGGHSADPDDYVTEHEGWQLHGHFAGGHHTLYEIDKYATPPKLGPTSLSAQIKHCLLEHMRGRSPLSW